MPSTPEAVHGGTPHILALDGLRGVAILGVFAFHYGGGATSSSRIARAVAHAVQFGGAGVTLFFVLSGFLITGILLDSLDQPHALRSFYIRRALRIFPLYYVTLLFTLVYAMLTHNTAEVLHKLWVPALFLQNIGHLDRLIAAFPVRVWMIHYWSLAVEEHFYFVWPFLLLLTGKRHAARLCIVVCAISVLIPIAVAPFWRTIELCDYPLITSAAALALGGWLATAQRSGLLERLQPYWPYIAAGSFLLLLPFVVHTAHFTLTGGSYTPFETLSRFDLVVFFTSIVALSLHPGLTQRLASTAWLRSIGRVSYGIYIYHLFFWRVFHLWARDLAGSHGGLVPAITAVIALICTPILAYTSYAFLEKPFLRLKDRFAPRIADPIAVP
jgi:peptidoglycan/LPS O-acetylase OafA/YrhL